MKIKKIIKEGLVVLAFYSVFSMLVVMASNRVERLEKNNFSTEKRGFVLLKISK